MGILEKKLRGKISKITSNSNPGGPKLYDVCDLTREIKIQILVNYIYLKEMGCEEKRILFVLWIKKRVPKKHF